jgi:hypothetical protein
MNDIRDIYKLLVQTGDGRSVLAWFFVFAVFFVRSAITGSSVLHLLKYIFFSIIIFLVFVRFRVNDFENLSQMNVSGMLAVNAWGLFFIYMEFFHE